MRVAPRIWRAAEEVLTLQTRRARLIVWAGASAIIYVLPYKQLAHLSLWQAMGWHSAPSIGLTRAYWQLIHGNLPAAWHRNELIFLVVIVWAGIMINDWVLTPRQVKRFPGKV